MSHAYQRRLSLAGIDSTQMSEDELRAMVRVLLAEGIHGLCFSPYLPDQAPGTPVEAAAIVQRLEVVRPHVSWIRTFSCTDGNELIPPLARARGLRTMVGVWLGDDREKNEEELANGIAVARAGHADILAVGNEVLLREDLGEDELVTLLERARQAVPGVPVGYVDAYFKFVDYPRVTAACDVLLANCYPFWEGCPAEYALPYMKDMYRRAVGAAHGKPVIVSETGWPTRGADCGGARPSYRNAIKYFIDTCQWAQEDGVEVFYFSAFDEPWKVATEGDVGAYWGLWDQAGDPKYW
ncbi:glycosyl hydrolase family 17 protein [Thioalkalivibrio sp. XN8]|uniref:glycoside hydrolase family 17 protein n=1 Tax=Thioalkalivibrio sp. XN8 TaxID=2712863 RepID=UPI0013E9E37F|nr:glycosyl hydrolase family 17 protein [Thioalkalivibrio sp. XN8]NGP54437.1 glycosyl hydrolase [Thioalkalivibrio sp. XN8]